MPRIGRIARLEVKMIGKPYAGELHVRFDEGEQDIVLRTMEVSEILCVRHI
jgi:hypothetical protein